MDATKDIVQDRVFNEQLLNVILESPDGKQKEAAEAGSRYIRTSLRENGFTRRILPFETVSDTDLHPLPDQEMPVIWGEMQIDSPAARSITMKDTADTEFFWKKTFICRFFVITTPEFTKNTFELKGHVNDTVKILTEQSLKDIETEEDTRWINEVDDVVGTAGGVGQAGVPQNFYIGPFSRVSYTDAQFLLTDRRLPNGVFLANERFLGNFQKLNRSEIGGDLAQDMFRDGARTALKSGNIGGIAHLFTIKNNLVPNDTLYLFTEPRFLGLAFEYQKPTLYVKKEKRTLIFSADEIIAITIANVAGVAKVKFEEVPGD